MNSWYCDQGRGTNLESSRLSTLGRLILGLLLLGLLGRARRQALLSGALDRLGGISLIGRHIENSRAGVEDLVEEVEVRSSKWSCTAMMAGHKGH